MSQITQHGISKVPEVTVAFWIIKIAATTLGETGGDAVSMSMQLGYAIGSAIFLSVLVVAVAGQIAARSFHPFLYWAVIVATTTAGTTMADFADRSLGVGYAGGSSILFVLLIMSLGIWYWSAGSVSVDTIASPKVEMFYWVTILFSQHWAPRLVIGWPMTPGWGSVTKAGHSFSPPAWYWSRPAIFKRACRARCCSGARSSSHARWVRRWAICSTNCMQTAGSL
jgi:hypothetical protein